MPARSLTSAGAKGEEVLDLWIEICASVPRSGAEWRRYQSRSAHTNELATEFNRKR